MGHKVRIGYSFWGFLGAGVTDTPDGGRSHRRTLIDGLIGRGHEVVFLQANRDRDEAGEDMTSYRWDACLPEVDALFLEWRWPIEGRNTTPCGTTGHTCDLHRQAELLDHYTASGVPTLLWDKDLQLPAHDPVRCLAAVTVCEAALHPRFGANTLLFPVDDSKLDLVDAEALASRDRDVPLCYVGNQYDRDDAFDAYFAAAAATTSHVVAGKWTATDRWPGVNFVGRVPFPDVERLYCRSLATVTLLPERYARAGQMTQRLAESVLAGCIPLVPTSVRSHQAFGPPETHVSAGADVVPVLHHIASIAGRRPHVELLQLCIERLDQFRLTRQLAVVEDVLGVPTASAEAPR